MTMVAWAGVAVSSYGVYSSSQQKAGGNGVGMSSPSSPYAGQYAADLYNLQANPTQAFQNSPYGGFLAQQGVQGAMAGDAASGRTGGGMSMDAMQFSQQYAGNWYNQQVQLLSGMAGANGSNYAAAGGLQNSQFNQGNQGIGQGVGGVLSGLQGIFGNTGSGNPNMSSTDLNNYAMALGINGDTSAIPQSAYGSLMPAWAATAGSSGGGATGLSSLPSSVATTY